MSETTAAVIFLTLLLVALATRWAVTAILKSDAFKGKLLEWLVRFFLGGK